MPSDRDPNHLYPSFREKIAKVLEELDKYADKHMPGYRWKIVEGFRTAAYQNELYQKGRTKPGQVVTMRDGYKRRSNHQSSLAVDLVPFKGTSPTWNVALEHWGYLGHCARAEGLTWGGDWEKLRDMPHLEWKEEDAPTYQAAKKWQKDNGLK
jgi:peptidoglycan L-alanyl-D-glutamate endopeptidase CwlK